MDRARSSSCVSCSAFKESSELRSSPPYPPDSACADFSSHTEHSGESETSQTTSLPQIQMPYEGKNKFWRRKPYSWLKNTRFHVSKFENLIGSGTQEIDTK